jgi:hypothetical protein
LRIKPSHSPVVKPSPVVVLHATAMLKIRAHRDRKVSLVRLVRMEWMVQMDSQANQAWTPIRSRHAETLLATHVQLASVDQKDRPVRRDQLAVLVQMAHRVRAAAARVHQVLLDHRETRAPMLVMAQLDQKAHLVVMAKLARARKVPRAVQDPLAQLVQKAQRAKMAQEPVHQAILVRLVPWAILAHPALRALLVDQAIWVLQATTHSIVRAHHETLLVLALLLSNSICVGVPSPSKACAGEIQTDSKIIFNSIFILKSFLCVLN